MSYSPKNLVYRYTVGNGADFATLPEAVTWFNSNGIGNSELLVDGGVHQVPTTITINNVSGYPLNIRGLDSAVTYVAAATGLAGLPMFNIVTPCDFRQMTLVGGNATLGGLVGYGVNPGENCFKLNTTADLYCEITDIIIDTFYIAVTDTIGSDIFLYNFVVSDCQTGVAINYTTNSPVTFASIDAEVGNFDNCPIGINLIKTGAAKKGDFYLSHLIFNMGVSTDIGVKYDGANYIYGSVAEMTACTYNKVGTVASGFDFTNARDADIRLVSNTGVEDSKPHAKINVYANGSTTTITTANVLYKAVFTNSSYYTTKMTITNNKMLYQSSITKDGMMWLSGALSVDQNARNLKVCLRREVTVTSVNGGVAVATVVTTNPHNMDTGQQVQMLGWSSTTYNGIKTITKVNDYTFTYPNTANVGVVTGGTCGNLMGLITVRNVNASNPVNFSTNCYVEDMIQNGYSEIYVSSTGNGDVITVSDVAWLFNTV